MPKVEPSHASCTDNPCSNTVYGGVEEVEPDEDLIQCVVAYDLLCNFFDLVFKEDDMIRIPADRARHVERHLIKESEKAWNFVADILGWVIVTVVTSCKRLTRRHN